MRKLKQKSYLGIFAFSFLLLLLLAPVLQQGMSTLGLVYSPYKYMLNMDTYSLTCRLPGIFICLVLAIVFRTVNTYAQARTIKRFENWRAKSILTTLLILLFALILPIGQIVAEKHTMAILNAFKPTQICSRQTTYYLDIWLYMTVSYLISCVAVGLWEYLVRYRK